MWLEVCELLVCSSVQRYAVPMSACVVAISGDGGDERHAITISGDGGDGLQTVVMVAMRCA